MNNLTPNRINALMREILTSDSDAKTLLKLLASPGAEKAYRAFLEGYPLTAHDLTKKGIPFSSAYRLLVRMAEYGLIVQTTLKNINGSKKPSVAWRLT